MSNTSPTALLLNAGHAMDHLFLLIFATAVPVIAAELGMVWQDLMPYTVGAFVLFGAGARAFEAGRTAWQKFWERCGEHEPKHSAWNPVGTRQTTADCP